MKHSSFLFLLLILNTSSLLSQNGLKADYYDGTQFNRYVGTKYVDKIDFFWDKFPPLADMNPNECSVRYTGRLKSPKTGEVTFSARVDDGIRVWVNEVLVINNWQLNDVGFSEGTIQMQAGEYYDLKIEYFNALREAELRLLWKLPEEEEKGWFKSWWYGNEPIVIPAEYYAPPIETVLEENPEPEAVQVAEIPPKTQPKPKPRRITKPKPMKKQPILVPAERKPLDTIQRYIPKTVEFNRKESDILPISYPALDQLATFLARHPHQKIRIEGHTDNVGDATKNFQLSQRRAYAVAAYLVKKGVNAKQLSAEGFGGAKPLVAKRTKKYHPENRRVEFILE